MRLENQSEIYILVIATKFDRSEFINHSIIEFSCGGVAERSNAAVLKTVNRVFGSWVRIPPPPPFMLFDCMTRTHKVSKGRIFLTIACLLIFGVLVSVADKCSTPVDLTINPTFVSDWSKDVSINLNAMSISMDDANDAAVVQYIVQEWDILESIATEFWTTVKNLKKINWVSSIKPWQKIIVTNEEDGILYKVRENQNIKVFANKYGLDLKDLMTLNYITDDSEILYQGQEIFINISEEKANKIAWFIDKAQPDLTIPVKSPTKTTTTKTSSAVKTTTTSTAGANVTISNVTTNTSSSKILKKRTYNANINNGFYRGYCTWYVATQVPSIFHYTSETTQERPFGWDAIKWYNNAKAAWYTVSKTPRSNSIVVYSKLRSSAGHVWIVRQYPYNWDSSKMLVEDMNYAWKFVVTQRIESTSRGEIIWYIYY